MNKNVIIDITSYIRHLTKMVIKVSLAMILAVEMLSGSITGVWKGLPEHFCAAYLSERKNRCGLEKAPL